jgi:hypothetical protein
MRDIHRDNGVGASTSYPYLRSTVIAVSSPLVLNIVHCTGQLSIVPDLIYYCRWLYTTDVAVVGSIPGQYTIYKNIQCIS